MCIRDRRYGSEWIFKNVNYTFESDNKYALIGPNGSGKSTLMKLISGGFCLLYTSDAADERSSVDLGGRRIIKKKHTHKKKKKTKTKQN